MLFNSLTFLVFFAVMLGLHRLPLAWNTRKGILLVGSYIFYASWNPPFVVLLWISTLVDWFVARRLDAVPDARRSERRWLVAVSLLVNLGMLGFFKYGLFFLDNFVELVNTFGIPFEPARPGIILPIGISFYTFQTISYSLDVYFRKSKPSKSFLDYALFVTFFPQLVAGPIVRPSEFLPQAAEERRASADEFARGIFLLTLGLFQKVILADFLLAPIVEKVYSGGFAHNFQNSTTGMLAFSGQVFFDLNGYTNCAIGVAACLGFHLPRNFRFPYGAIGIADHWRRWHMSLATWLRDYLYFPLGGSKFGEWITARNLMITFILTGFWHGAAWTFVVWGGIQGVYLVIERHLRNRFGHMRHWTRGYWPFLLAVLTYILTVVANPFFRAPDIAMAWDTVAGLFTFASDDALGKTLKGSERAAVFLFCVFLFLQHWRWRESTGDEILESMSRRRLVFSWLVMLFVLIIFRGGEGNAFIYFQF